MRCDRPVPGMHPRVCCRLRQTLHLAVPGYRATLQSHGRHVNLQASLQREALDADILYTPDIPLQPFSSPQLEPRAMPGRGIGLVASSDIPAGELLMVVTPLHVVLSGREGQQPDPDRLAHALLDQVASMAPSQQAAGCASANQQQQQSEWLQVLSLSTQPGAGQPGEQGTAAAELPTPERLRRIQRLLRQQARTAPTPRPSGASTVQGEEGSRAPGPPDSLLSLARSLVSANSASGHSQDPAAARLRRLTPEQRGGHCGLWPAFSLLNHSCAPNASYMALGAGADMVVRAAQHIPQGEEVTISYMGAGVLEPLAQRRAYLQSKYGFTCTCSRCSLEASLPAEAQALLGDLAAAGQLVQQATAEAVSPEAGPQADTELVQEAGRAAQAKRREFAALVSQLSQLQGGSNPLPGGSGLPVAAVRWLQGSVYPVFSPTAADLVQLCDVAQPEDMSSDLSWALGRKEGGSTLGRGLGVLPSLDAAQPALDVLEQVAPGSDLHVSIGTQHLLAAERVLGAALAGWEGSEEEEGEQEGDWGEGDGTAWARKQLQEAEERVYTAYAARYGRVSREMFERLLWLNAAARLPEPLVRLCLELRSGRLSRTQLGVLRKQAEM